MRYNTNLTNTLKALLMSIVVFALISTTPIFAQDEGPQNYCNPLTWSASPGLPTHYYYCYPDYPAQYPTSYKDYYGGSITYVRITNSAGEVILYKYTGPDFSRPDGQQSVQWSSCYHYYEDNYTGTGGFAPGETYTIEVQLQAHYYWYAGWPNHYYCGGMYDYGNSSYRMGFRMFVDYGIDGYYGEIGDDYYSNNDGSDEYVLSNYYYLYGYNSRCATRIYTNTFTIPADVEPGKTRMRLLATAYVGEYPYIQYRNNACLNGYYYVYAAYDYVYNFGEAEEYLIEFTLPIKGTYPGRNDILFAEKDYDGIDKDIDGTVYPFPKPMIELRSAVGSGTFCTFQIKGPLPGQGVVYNGLTPSGDAMIDLSVPFDAGNPLMFEFSNSSGSASTAANDGTVNFSRSGEYYVEYNVWLPGKIDPLVVARKFTVSFSSDLAVVEITNPVKFYPTEEKPYMKRYSRGLDIPLAAIYRNTGKSLVELFDAEYTIYKAIPIYANGVIVDYEYSDEFELSEIVEFNADNSGTAPLNPLDEVKIEFGTWRPQETGIYIVDAHCKLRSGTDQEPYNDTYPRSVFLSGEPNVWPYGSQPMMMFEVADEIESQALESMLPAQGDTVIVNRPFFPVCDVKNNGVSDISNPLATITFSHKTIANKTVVKNLTVEDIPAGMYNRKSITFPVTVFDTPGEWVAEMRLTSQGDDNKDNDVISWSFYVAPSVSGKYTIGAGQDFETVTEAMDYLYLYGINGDVELILTDAIYDVIAPAPEKPAWDFATAIVGLGYHEEDGSINTLTIRPSDIRAVSRAGVTIRLYTSNGKGIYMGQDITNNSDNAIIKENLLQDQYTKYYNSQGYITFDGFENKALKFELHSQSEIHGAVFYLNRGSSNITIQNCIIENQTPILADRIYLPHPKHDQNSEGFTFEPDSAFVDGAYNSYSAGIVNRSSLFNDITVAFDEFGNPIDMSDPDAEGFDRNIVIDTVPNTNNVFRNNEISGFGYGIMSLGIGVLMNPKTQLFQSYANRNNLIEGNIISNIAATGILVGNEEELKIVENSVFNITGAGNGNSVGIQVGFQSRGSYNGYFNSQVEVRGNTVFSIIGQNLVNGIRVLQGNVAFEAVEDGSRVMFPKVDDDIKVYANAIWGLEALDPLCDVAGIHILSERVDASKASDNYDQLKTARFPSVFMTGIEVSNNTILISEDNIDNQSLIFGAGIQSSVQAEFFNNAVSIEDNTISAMADVRSCLFLQGSRDVHAFTLSDNNAYWFTDDDVDLVRYIESEPALNPLTGEYSNAYLHPGFNGEYRELRQWRNWTGADMNSTTTKDFMDDYEFVTEDYTKRLRISNDIEMASVLNNRGRYLGDDHFDIYGVQRGAAGEPFDIGAIEFKGEMFAEDAEVVDISLPANYRETFGRFNDNEFLMTTSPVEVVAHVRNNGENPQLGLPVTVTIQRDNQGALSTVLETTINLNVDPYTSLMLPFDLADGEGLEFEPETFAELDLHVDDNLFYGMEENITPVYTITVKSEDDENKTDNNVSVKKIRFFVMRAGTQILECNSAANENYENSTQTDIIANNYNAAAIEEALLDIGYYNVTRGVAKANRLANEDVDTAYRQDIDHFNRNSWPTRSLDYSMYRTLIWSDGHNSSFAQPVDGDVDPYNGRYAAMALRDYVNSYDEAIGQKKNLIVASEEIVRNNLNLDYDYDFVTSVFHATSLDPHTPMGITNGNLNPYDGKGITGVDIVRDHPNLIISTGLANDAQPYPALLSIVPADGVTKVGTVYNELQIGPAGDIDENQRIMAITHVDTDRNIILHGADWRHFGDVADVMRSSIDVIERNDGIVWPVDLYKFAANRAGNHVELSWSTVSENGASHFDVERKVIDGDYSVIANKEAAGFSSNIQHYSLSDLDVKLGNTYVYRLRMVDNDGSFSYSDEKTVELETVSGTLTIGEITPNPVSTAATILVNTNEATNLKVELFNSTGASVYVAYDKYTAPGTQEISLDVNNLSQGSYSLIITSGENSEIKSLNIVK